MSYSSIWPVFPSVLVLFLFAATPAFASADAPPIPSPSRVNTLDGLRGFLALAVFFQHAVIYHDFVAKRSWRPPSNFYEVLGEMGVDLFFMITGFLFWSQMIRSGGRPRWVRLYVGRLARIAPLYVFAIALMLAIVSVRTGLHLQVRPSVLFKELVPWASLGLLSTPDINAYPNTTLILCGVTWSLRYEWLFYLSLLVTHLAARTHVTKILFPAVGLVGALAYTAVRQTGKIPPYNSVFVALFCSGMLVAAAGPLAVRGKSYARIASAIVVLTSAALLSFFSTTRAVVPVVLIAIIFYLVANGADMFGVLTSRPAKRLGDISFGIYLLQGLVLTAVYWGGPVRTFALSSPWLYWTTTLIAGLLLISFAAFAHAVVERPGIALGLRLTGRRAVAPTRTVETSVAPERAL